MEQYMLKLDSFYEQFTLALSKYSPIHAYVRPMGSSRNKKDVYYFSQEITSKDISCNQGIFIKECKPILIDTIPPTLAYHRKENNGNYVMMNQLMNPYDEAYPWPHTSTFRLTSNINNITHLVELSFHGRVGLEKDGKRDDFFYYWKIK